MTYEDPNLLKPNDPSRRDNTNNTEADRDLTPPVRERSSFNGTIGILAGVIAVLLILAFVFGYSGQNSQTAGVSLPPTTSAPPLPSQASRSAVTPPETTGQASPSAPAPSTPGTPPAPNGNAQ